MTIEEFSKIGIAIKTYYPKETNLFKDEKAVEAWYQLLKDLDYQTTCIALNKWVATERWSPTIADLRKMCYEVSSPKILTWDEAWENVLQAIRYYGYNRRVEALDSLDDLTRKAVNRVGWMQICNSEEIGVERANFREIYKAIAERQIKEGQVAPAVRTVIQVTQNSRKAILTDKTIKNTDKAENSVKTQNKASDSYSDRIQDLINKTKENLKGGNQNYSQA